MKQIIEYTIKRSEDSHWLAKYVQEAIEEGWQPFGDVFNSGCSMCQPMVKYEEPYTQETLFRGVPISKLSPEEKAEFMDETLGIKPLRKPGRNPLS